MAIKIVTPGVNQLGNVTRTLLSIDFVPPKVRAYGLREVHSRPYDSRGKRPSAWMTAAVPSLPWNGLESLDWAEILASVMPGGEAGMAVAVLILACFRLKIVGWFKIEFSRLKLEFCGKVQDRR